MYLSTTNEIMVLVTLVAIGTFRKICGIPQSKEIAFFPFLIYTTLYMYIYVHRNICVHIYTHIYINTNPATSSIFQLLPTIILFRKL